MIALPDGYTLGISNRQSVTNARHMLGDSWQVTVYHKGEPAFDMAKELRIDQWSPVYAGRLRGGKWQQYTDIHELVRVMCSKHRIGVGK